MPDTSIKENGETICSHEQPASAMVSTNVSTDVEVLKTVPKPASEVSLGSSVIGNFETPFDRENGIIFVAKLWKYN